MVSIREASIDPPVKMGPVIGRQMSPVGIPLCVSLWDRDGRWLQTLGRQELRPKNAEN